MIIHAEIYTVATRLPNQGSTGESGIKQTSWVHSIVKPGDHFLELTAPNERNQLNPEMRNVIFYAIQLDSLVSQLLVAGIPTPLNMSSSKGRMTSHI
jgi:hypothetical protein